MEISLSLSECMSIPAESTIEPHPLSPRQQTLFARCKIKNRLPSLILWTKSCETLDLSLHEAASIYPATGYRRSRRWSIESEGAGPFGVEDLARRAGCLFDSRLG